MTGKEMNIVDYLDTSVISSPPLGNVHIDRHKYCCSKRAANGLYRLFYDLIKKRVQFPAACCEQTNDEQSESRADTPQLAAGSFMCVRRAHVLTGESPESARQWEGYSRTSRALLRGRV